MRLRDAKSGQTSRSQLLMGMMRSTSLSRRRAVVPCAMLLGFLLPAHGQINGSKKVFVVADLRGVETIFNLKNQAIPYQSPRWEESRELLTGDVNAAADGLFAGGAAGVDIYDAYAEGQNLSTLTISPKARLLVGRPVSPTLQLEEKYAAVVFIGQQAMAGAQHGVLNGSYDARYIQRIWVNNKLTGEIGARTMLAGYFGIPVIMLSGDEAACKELRDLIPKAGCATVKWGVSRIAGYTLPTPQARALIREETQRAMERLPQIQPYTIDGPVEVKVEFTTEGASTRLYPPREGVEHLNQRTWVFRGKNIVDAWVKFQGF